MGATGSKEDLEFVHLVGKGFFGEVYKARYKGTRLQHIINGSGTNASGSPNKRAAQGGATTPSKSS